jgi:hypothetical protein
MTRHRSVRALARESYREKVAARMNANAAASLSNFPSNRSRMVSTSAA